MTRIAHASEPERRLSLLKAAFREVAEKGFSEVTLDDIARRAGVSKGVTLYYFDSKEDALPRALRLAHRLDPRPDARGGRRRRRPGREGPRPRRADLPVAVEEPRVLPRLRGLLRPRGAARGLPRGQRALLRGLPRDRRRDRGGGDAPRRVRRARPEGGRLDDAGDLRRPDDAVAVREGSRGDLRELPRSLRAGAPALPAAGRAAASGGRSDERAARARSALRQRRVRAPGRAGGALLPTCGLERSLFDPQARRQAAERRADGRGENGRR